MSFYNKTTGMIGLITVLFFIPAGYLVCQEKSVPAAAQEETDQTMLRDNVAVLDFSGKNVSSEDASIFSDMVRSDMVKLNKVNVIDKTNMDKLLAESKFQQTGATTTADAVKLGKILNVQKVVMGSPKMENNFYVNANYVDIETAKIEKSEMLQCKELGELMNVADELTTNLLSPAKVSKAKSKAKAMKINSKEDLKDMKDMFKGMSGN